MSEETIDEIINNKQSNDNKPNQLISTFNKWGTHRRSTTIGNNISIRFGKTISLGIKYYDKNMNKLTKKYGLSFDDFVYRINKLPINKQKIFFLTFMDTMSLQYISENFVCWNDIKNNTLWKLSVEQYLFELIHKIINAYKNNILKKPSFIKNEQFNNKLNHFHKKYLKHTKSFEKQKKRKLHKLQNDTNESQTENERNENQTNESEPPLKKRKIESLRNNNIKIETTTSPISQTSDTSSSSSTSSNSTSITGYSNITIPDFNVNSIPNFNNMPQFNIPSIRNNNNTYNTYNTINNINNNINISNENYINISAINNQLEILENGQKQEHVQQQMQQMQQMQQVQQQMQLQLQTDGQCQLPYEPQFLPNINLNDLNNYNMNQNINGENNNNNNGQDVITVKYRIRVDWNGISIQQL